MISPLPASFSLSGGSLVQPSPEPHSDNMAGEGFEDMAGHLAALLLPGQAEEGAVPLPGEPAPLAEEILEVNPLPPKTREDGPLGGVLLVPDTLATAQEGDMPASAPARGEEEPAGERALPHHLVMVQEGERQTVLPELMSRGEDEPARPLRFRHFAETEPAARAEAQPGAHRQPDSPVSSVSGPGRRTSALALQGELALKASAPMPPAALATQKPESTAPSAVSVPSSALATERPLSAAVHEWAAIRVENSAAGNKAALGEQLLHALKEKVELQLNQQVQQARIKLDPPEMGRLELTVRLEGDRLHIQLNASQGAVREALASQLDRLRADLLPHHAGGVEVNVGQDDRRQRGEHNEAAIAKAIAEEEDTTGGGARARDWINALA
ncbi:flagellar hook-length control protein FliK [Zobellella denitrificans]